MNKEDKNKLANTLGRAWPKVTEAIADEIGKIMDKTGCESKEIIKDMLENIKLQERVVPTWKVWKE